MTAFLYQYRAWLAPLFTLIALTLVLTAIFIPLNAKQTKYNDIIKKSQPRIERLQGLLAGASNIETQLSEAKRIAKAQLYPADTDENKLNNELQTRLRNLAHQSGLTVGSIRTNPLRKENGVNTHLLSLNLQGGMPELQKLLITLQQPDDAAPALRVDSLFLSRNNFALNMPQTLSIDITVAAMRANRP